MTAPILSEIVDNGLCLGCGACVAAINRPDLTMGMRRDGYLRPDKVALTVPERELLGDVCPGYALDGHDGQPDYHPLWGPIRVIATGHATDAAVRHRGSSGGVITALSIGLIESGEVEFVLTNAAAKDESVIVRHYSPRRAHATRRRAPWRTSNGIWMQVHALLSSVSRVTWQRWHAGQSEIRVSIARSLIGSPSSVQAYQAAEGRWRC
jgi:hypothetical protein